jgi:uncharacterized protein (TIGR00297 family)
MIVVYLFEMLEPSLIVLAAAVSAAFAILARWLRGVTTSGAIAGALISFVLYAGLGPAGFTVLVALFALTWAATRTGYRRKQHLGTAESQEGRRASQVLANLGAGAICVIAYRMGGNVVWVLAFVAALAEAAADTVSSEIGQSRSDTARLITTLRPVPAGTDGGISLSGTVAGVAAAILITAVAAAFHLVPWSRIGIPVLAAAFGMMADSVLGAELERPGKLNNDAVNFLSTCIAVAVAYLFS